MIYSYVSQYACLYITSVQFAADFGGKCPPYLNPLPLGIFPLFTIIVIVEN